MFEEEESLMIYVNATVDIQHKSKEDILKELIILINENSSAAFDIEEVFLAVKEREALSTTGFGEGFAIPHGKSSVLVTPLVAVMRLPHSVNWDAMDEEPVDTVIMLLVPSENGDTQHLKLLSQLSYNLMDSAIQKALKSATTDKELFSTVQMMLAAN